MLSVEDIEKPYSEEVVLLAYMGAKQFEHIDALTFFRCVPQRIYKNEADLICSENNDFQIVDPPGWYIGSSSDLKGEGIESFEDIACTLGDEPNILIIRDNGAGDVMMSVPTVRKIRERIPRARIVYATLARNACVLDGVGCVDAVIDVETVDLSSTCKWDLVINWARAVENYEIPRNRKHRIESFAEHIGIALGDDEKEIELHLDESLLGDACQFMIRNGVDFAKPIIGYVMKAVGWNRTYPMWRVPEIAKEIRKSIPEAQLLLLDNQDELYGMWNGSDGVINLCGCTESFSEAAAVLQLCDVVIAPDSGLAHASAALGKPTVVLAGSIPAGKVRFGQSNVTVLQKSSSDVDCCPCWDWQERYKKGEKRGRLKSCNLSKKNVCLEEISPAEIANAVGEMIDKGKYKETEEKSRTEKEEVEKNIVYPKIYTEFSVIVPVLAVDKAGSIINMGFIGDLKKHIDSAGGEMVVVANGCCNEFTSALKDINVTHVVIDERVSYARACNEGAKAARTFIYCFLNSDVVINDPAWFGECVKALGQYEVGAVGATGMNLNESWAGDGYFDTPTDEFDFLEGWCVWVTRETFKKIGGWDERFKPYYSEDADISFKIKHTLGKKLVICRAVERPTHIGGMTIKNVDRGIETNHMKHAARILRDKWSDVFTPRAGFDDERIAIIIPAHVEPVHLHECLISIAASGLKNVSIYVGLDRMEFAGRGRYPHVKFFDLDFGHPGKTRNYLVEQSVEPIIYFFDADDILIPWALPKLLIAMRESDADVVYGKAKIFYDERYEGEPWFTNVDKDGFLNTRKYDRGFLRAGNFISTQSLVRREALPSSRPFDEEMPALEDWDLWLTMSEQKKKFLFVDIPLWLYRMHENNLTRDASKNRIANAMLIEKHGNDIGALIAL